MTDQAPIPTTQPQAEAEADYDDGELLAKFQGWDKQLLSHWGKWRGDTRELYDVVAGEQWAPEDKAALAEQGRVAPVFNRIGPMIDAVSGAEITGRQEVQYYPRTPGESAINEVLTKGAEWIRDQADADQEESDAFFDCLVCGLGWTETRLDYDEEPTGKICIDRVDPLEMWPDPSCRKRNLTDARYLRRVKRMSKDEFDELFPGKDPDTSDITDGIHNVDPKNFYDGDGDNARDDDVFVREYQWFESVTRMLVQHPQDPNRVVSATPEEFEEANEQAKAGGVELQALKQKQRQYWRAFVSGDQILEKGPLQQGEFTLKAITGKRDRNKGTWYGLVKPMLDPQRWSNQFYSQIIAILATTAKGGMILESDAVEDIKQFEKSWADPRKATIVQPGTLSAGKIQPKPATPYPSGIERLLQMANQSMTDVTGVNEEILGMAERDQPGVLEYQRKQAAYGILAAFFDSLKRYRKEQGRLLLRLMRFLPENTLVRIVNDQGLAQYVPLALDPTNDKFDVIVDEAADGPDKKERVWQMIGQMLPLLQNANLPMSVWAKIIQFSPLPSPLAAAISNALLGMQGPGGAPGAPQPQGGAPQGQPTPAAPGQPPQPGQPGAPPPAPAPADLMALQEHQADVEAKHASATKDFAQAGKFQAETNLANVKAGSLTPPQVP